MLRRTVGGEAASSASLVGIELEVLRVDDHVRAGHLSELADLDRRPGGLHRAATADDEDLPDRPRR